MTSALLRFLLLGSALFTAARAQTSTVNVSQELLTVSQDLIDANRTDTFLTLTMYLL